MIERESRVVGDLARSSRGDVLPYRPLLDQLRGQLSFAEAVIISSLPRGSLQITQPQKVSEAMLKGYAREFHRQDRLTWQAIERCEALCGVDAWGAKEYESSKFLNDFLHTNGLRYVMAAPLSAPVIDGYPGALHLYRAADQGAFTDADVRRLTDFASELDAAILKTRQARQSPGPSNTVLRHVSPSQQIIFNSQLRPQFGGDAFGTLDERLREAMLDHARQRFNHVNGEQVVADRVPLADSRGDLWNFRVVVHSTYPALGEGPFVFFCQQPETAQWSALRSTDFQADSEIARLVPALKYMREHFSKGPTLVGIAKTVHLSPFHFHRRFTELLGITPKHFLLDCQIEEAKRMLVGREMELADIATACGFAHQSHFTSRFKQATGLTPTRWRKLAIEAQRPGVN